VVQPYTADDYLYRDGNETVTLSLSGGEPFEIDYGLRSGISKREADRSEGAYTQSDTWWSVPGLLVSPRPKPKDVLTATDGDWVVLECVDEFWTDWRCACRRLKIEPDLSELITIKVEVAVPTRGGRPNNRLDDAFVNVRAKIHESGGRKSTEDDRARLVTTHRVFLDSFRALKTNHVFVDSAGAHYRFVAYDWPEELDRLPAYEVRKIEGE
jgi:hypothetical protein